MIPQQSNRTDRVGESVAAWLAKALVPNRISSRRLPVVLALWIGCYLAAGLSNDARADDARRAERERMIERQIAARGVKDERVLGALRDTPRHEFVPEDVRDQAYQDRPLPIGFRQTISQPYIVALMSEVLALSGDEIVLEIGTGSGYQAAVLGRLAKEVYTIEIVRELGERAKRDLARLGYSNVHVRVGDGYQGWPEHAPFDAIVVTAAPEHVPQPLIDQLAVGGRMVLPVGRSSQQLVLLRRTTEGIQREKLIDVRFVPMTGEAQRTP
jgi:protein-L-isoaspartate(D-aspartate) O-methyltransferase